ncbi:MAG: FtsX-like permease family protein, partial [Proteobacteria bacterium]|nr:FtsX-like permease family protein [Pseudomonadota bacterium]
GIDLLNEASVSGANNRKVIPDPLSFMADPSSIALTNSLALDEDLKLGSQIVILTPEGERILTVGALFEEKDFTDIFGSRLGIIDIEAARLMFKREGKIDQINIKLKDKSTLIKTVASIKVKLGDAVTVAPPSQLVDNLRSTLRPFQLLLQGMALLAFFLVLYLVTNMGRIAIEERRREFGIMRAMGCPKSKLGLLVGFEYGILGLLSAVSGASLALFISPLFAHALKRILGVQFGTSLPIDARTINPVIPFVIAGIAVVLVLIAIARSILRIMDISPTEALTLVFESEGNGKKPPLIPLFVLGVTAPLLFIELHPVYLMIPLVTLIWSGPYVIYHGLAFCRGFFSSRFRLPADYAISAPQRLMTKLRGFFIGLLILFVVHLVQSSFEMALNARFVNTSRPDLFVTANGDLISPFNLQPLHESLRGELAALPFVTEAFAQRITKVRFRDKMLTLKAFDEISPDNKKLKAPYSYFDIVDRSTPDAGTELYHLYPLGGLEIAVLASETFWNLFQLRTGDTFELESPKGKLKAKIVGVIRDLSAGSGSIFMDRKVYRHWWSDELVTGLALTIDPGASEEVVKKSIEDRFAESHGVVVTPDRKLRLDAMSLVKKGFFSLSIIEALILFVAMVNFAATLLFEIKGRGREYGTLRSIGMPKTQLLFLVLYEAALLLGPAILLAYLASVPLAIRLITSGITVSLGWYIGFYFDPWGVLFLAFLSSLLILLAAIFPALRASSVDVSETMRGE